MTVVPDLKTNGDGGPPLVRTILTPRSRVENPSPIPSPIVSPADESYEDDPEAGILWGPKQPNGHYTRWSRPWFDWRSEQSSRA
jgi:hypothetical protein